MNHDLYGTPKSQLLETHDSYRPSHAWKLFFLIWSPLNIWATYDSWMHDRDSEPLLYWIISLPVYTIFFYWTGWSGIPVAFGWSPNLEAIFAVANRGGYL